MDTDRRSRRSPPGAGFALLPVVLLASGACAQSQTVGPREASRADTVPTYAAASSTSPSASTTPRAQQSDEAIVERLSQARCQREDWCRNVGDGQAFASREVCLDTMRGGFGNDINEFKCPRGVDGVRLERCALAIQREQCDEPLDTIMRMDKCRSASICVQ